MSLPNEDKRFEAIQDFLNLSSAKSIDEILESIHRIGQFTQDISLNEIIEADEKAKQLLQHLSSLQKDLKNLKEIKQRLMGVKADNREELSKESLKRFSPGHDTNLPTKLIRFPALTRKEETKTSISDPLPASEKGEHPNIEIETESSGSKNLPVKESQVATKPQDALPSEREESLTTQPINSMQISQKRLLWKEIKPAFATTEVEGKEKAKEPEERIAKQGTAGHIQSAKAQATDKTINQSSHHDLDKEGLDFDQNLLKEIIRDYGEFDTYSKHTGEARKSTIAEANRKMDSLQTLPDRSVRVEFDRKLKKLIKDYGASDIYAKHTTDSKKRKMKKAIFAASVSTAVALFVLNSFFPFYRLGQSSTRDSLPSIQRPIADNSALTATNMSDSLPLNPIKSIKTKRKSGPPPTTQDEEPLTTPSSSESSANKME